MHFGTKAILLCLFGSGCCALVYQLIWIRLLGFAFGASTEAIATVLAIFFGGLALGNALAARHLARLSRPLLGYGLLELFIAGFALASLPLLWGLDDLYARFGAQLSAAGLGTGEATALRIAVAALLLLPPTVAMGATLPVIARAAGASAENLGRTSAHLYAANTTGAVAGAYLCGFWLIPTLGLHRSVLAAVVLNLIVAGAALWGALRVGTSARRLEIEIAAAPRSPADAGAAPGRRSRLAYLLAFGVSGFVAIGYEIVWSKVFSVIMEGTLYGFSSVLASYLLGIAVGSLAISRIVDRVRDLPRLFGFLHLAIGACVVLGMLVLPVLPYGLSELTRWSGGRDTVHLFLLLVLPIVFVPTALFGAAFPVLIRIYTRDPAGLGEGIGHAIAVNTAGSIASSLLVGFWWIPALGSDATLYLLLLLDLAVGFAVVFCLQRSQGWARLAGVATAGAALLLVALSYSGVRVERALVGRWVSAPDFAHYSKGLEAGLRSLRQVVEGRHAVVSIHESSLGRRISTNGMPESGRNYVAPRTALETALLGVIPYLLAEKPERALVVGFGGGGTAETLLHTELEDIEVVELEARVIEAAKDLYPAGGWPLDDPRLQLRIADGRHHLSLRRHRNAAGYDLIASQPSHPWLAGAANLFTEEFFTLARENLAPGGVFALWLNGFRIDPESALAVMTSFERIFPGAGLASISGAGNPRSSLLLLGSRAPLRWRQHSAEARLAEGDLASFLADYEIDGTAQILARFEGRLADFAAISPEAANTDDNARLEVTIPRQQIWSPLDYAAIEARLAEGAPVLPEIATAAAARKDEMPDIAAVVRASLDFAPVPIAQPGSDGVAWSLAPRVRRLLRHHGDDLDPPLQKLLLAEVNLRDPARRAEALASLRALADDTPKRDGNRIEALRALGAHYLAAGDRAAAAAAWESAFASSGAARDAAGAARAWHATEPGKAWQWATRVREPDRSDFPELLLYAAEGALEAGASPAALRGHFAALSHSYDSGGSRDTPGVEAILGRLALRLGEERVARGFLDADATWRGQQIPALLARARRAFAEGRLDDAARDIAEARRLAPSSVAPLRAAARLAWHQGDSEAFEATLAEIRRWAPSRYQGELVTTRLRLELGAPPFAAPPALSPQRLGGRTPDPPGGRG